MNKFIVLFLVFKFMTISILADDRLTISPTDTPKQVLGKLKMIQGKSKFSFNSDREFSISLTGKSKPNHEQLLNGKEPISAGYIALTIVDERIHQLSFSNKSGHVCPSYKSLNEVFHFFADRVKSLKFINLINDPNLEKCSHLRT